MLHYYLAFTSLRDSIYKLTKVRQKLPPGKTARATHIYQFASLWGTAALEMLKNPTRWIFIDTATCICFSIYHTVLIGFNWNMVI